MSTVSLVWFRNDLRLADHAALTAAAARGPVVATFVLDEEAAGAWPLGGASRWWLHHSLAALDRSLRVRGGRLVLLRGVAAQELVALARATGAARIVWSRGFSPHERAQDERVRSAARAAGLGAELHEGFLLHNPDIPRTGAGQPYAVFTPFWKNVSAELRVAAPLPTPALQFADPGSAVGLAVDELALLPRIRWDVGLEQAWTPGEAGAHEQLAWFAREAAASYHTTRNLPGIAGSSRLSPFLRWGELSPRQVWHAVGGPERIARYDGSARGIEVFLREIAWREFAWHVLYHFPNTLDEPLRPRWRQFRWEFDAAHLQAWQRGMTGFPLVDAGMRELWTTGWMHNRVRMVVASFLTKHLLMSWQEGARWFWDTLVDADAGNNTMGWQWAGGCGADAQPFFRIFNPVSQGEKFDPDGNYVRRWVPELAALPTERLHSPWLVPPLELAAAGVVLGRDYPWPIVDHVAARERALARSAEMGALSPGATPLEG